MPITPVFSVSQDSEKVIVVIRAPHVKTAEVDFYVMGAEFKFFVHPYFLRLTFSGELVENGREMAQYDIATGEFTVQLPKATPGEYFADLDMQTALMAKRPKPAPTRPLIEVLADQPDVVDGDGDTRESDEEFDWELDQSPELENDAVADITGVFPYGFDLQRTGVLRRLEADFVDMLELRDAERTSPAARTAARVAAEDRKFDPEYYMADFALAHDGPVEELITFSGMWWRSADALVVFSDAEQERMRRLPRRELLVTHTKAVLLSLVDIVFAYAYDHRTNSGEATVESAWTVARLSATLSWLEHWATAEAVVSSCMRRSLAYPLYRHWRLSCAVMRDVALIFERGRPAILRALLAVHQLLEVDDERYLLNELYITDYCVWLQAAPDAPVAALATHLQALVDTIFPDIVVWPLLALETQTRQGSGGGGDDNDGDDGDDDDDDDHDDDDQYDHNDDADDGSSNADADFDSGVTDDSPRKAGNAVVGGVVCGRATSRPSVATSFDTDCEPSACKTPHTSKAIRPLIEDITARTGATSADGTCDDDSLPDIGVSAAELSGAVVIRTSSDAGVVAATADDSGAAIVDQLSGLTLAADTGTKTVVKS